MDDLVLHVQTEIALDGNSGMCGSALCPLCAFYLGRRKLNPTPMNRLQLGQILVPCRRILAAKKHFCEHCTQLTPHCPVRRTLPPIFLEQL